MKHIIEFIIFENVLALDVTGPLEVFNTANEILKSLHKKHNIYEMRFVSQKKGNLKTSSGISFYADTDFKNTFTANTFVIPGGTDISGVTDNQDYMKYINNRVKTSDRVLSICKGVFILAETGILKGKKATTHWSLAEKFSKENPDIKVEANSIFTRDKNIFTSAGVTTGIDLALNIVEEDHGVSVALNVARALVLYFKRPGFQSQFSEPLMLQELAGKRFSSLYYWLEKNITKKITVEKMAEFCCMSERNFSRVFKKTVNITPILFLERLRTQKACELLINSEESLEKIAIQSGFQRLENLRRVFIKRFDISPLQYRNHFKKK